MVIYFVIIFLLCFWKYFMNVKRFEVDILIVNGKFFYDRVEE